MKARTDERGVTLIELVIVAMLIGALAAVSAPVFTSGGRSMSVWSAAHRLRADLRYAQEYAIMHHTDTAVVFVPLSHQWSLLQNGLLEAVPNPHLGTDWIVDLDSLTGVRLGTLGLSTPNAVTFLSTGECTSSGTIQLTDPTGGGSAQLTVEADTGFVRVDVTGT